MPIQAMKDWYKTHPHSFHKKTYERPGCDIALLWLDGAKVV